jgi:hypothetical protein
MNALTELARWEVFGFLLVLIALVCVQLLSGQINTKGLFIGRKGDGTSYLSPERVQLLVFTLAAAFQFLSNVLRDPSRFPVVSEYLIFALGGSHLFFLGGKLAPRFSGNRKDLGGDSIMSYSLELVIGYLVCTVIGLFALAVIWLILKGEINLDLLISEKTGEASMSRFQLLIFTFVIGLSFFLIVVSNSGLHPGAVGKAGLPDVPGGVLAMLGISATSYTVSKAIQANLPNKPTAVNPPPPPVQNQPGPAGQVG